MIPNDTSRGLGWYGTVALLGLAALLAPARNTGAQESKQEEKPLVRARIIADDRTVEAEVRQLEARLQLLKAELVQEKAQAELVARAMKEAEAKAREAAERQRSTAERDAVVARLSRLADGKTAQTLEAVRIAQTGIKGESLPYRIVLQKDGKHIIELPTDVIIAERNGKLLVEIPLAKTEPKKTADGGADPRIRGCQKRT